MIVVGLIALLYFLFSSSAQQATGNLFFGGNQKLYNVTLGQFFFVQASYPLLGKPVPYAHYQLGRTYFIMGNLQAALDEFNKELSLYPDTERSYYMLGLTYGYLNQENKAIENFQKFIDWKPTSWAARNDMAWLQFRLGDIDGALKTIQPVADLTDNAWVQNTYGTMLMNKKRYKEARIAFNNAKKAADVLTPTEWGKVYPGNDPRIYASGLTATRLSIESNLKLLDTK